MIDREKAIKGLSICSSGDLHSQRGRDCTNCPYYPAGWTGCTAKQLMLDALELLKAQEPLLIKRDTVDEIYGYIAECPNCGIHFSAWEEEKIRFCPGCGKAVKWDDA